MLGDVWKYRSSGCLQLYSKSSGEGRRHVNMGMPAKQAVLAVTKGQREGLLSALESSDATGEGFSARLVIDMCSGP